MSHARFIERFGAVWERSPWVAEATLAAGLPADADTAEGLHRAMCRAMRAGGAERQRALIEAHPDLAGRLAAAGRLTAESAGEQASAGLDRLTDDERARFTTLNAAYRARFGMPYIKAVKGLGKAAILADFERRLASEPESEIATALAEIERIALLRLRDLLP